MKQSTKAAKSSTKSSKKTNSNKKGVRSKELTDVNVAKAAKDEATERELKYRYPDDVKSGQDKKTFRRKARAAKNKFESQLRKLAKANDPGEVKERSKLQKEYEAWKSETYTSKEA